VTFEIKHGVRFLVQGNRLCNIVPDAQGGFFYNLKSVNQDGGSPWTETADVTVRWNAHGCSSGFMQLAGKPEYWPVKARASRITVYGNVADSVNTGLCANAGGLGDGLLLLGVNDVVFQDNWLRNPTNRSCLYVVEPSQRFVFQRNTCGGWYGLNTVGGWAVAAPGGIVTGNTVLPSGTAFTAWPAMPADSIRAALLRLVPAP
jgi:hypothetical protein